MSFPLHYDWDMGVEFKVFVVTVKDSPRWPTNLHFLQASEQNIVKVESLSTKFNSLELKNLHKGFEVYSLIVGRDMSLAELGCAYGHHAAYKSFLNSTVDWALILEDDACMITSLNHLLNSVAQLKGPSIISLIDRRGGLENPFGRRSEEFVPLWLPSQATSAYLINREAASIYLKNYFQNGILSPSDWPYPQVRKVAFYSLRNPIFNHDWSGTDSLIAQERNSVIYGGAYEPITLGKFTIAESLKRIRRLHSLGIPLKDTWYPEFQLKILCIFSLRFLSMKNRFKEFRKLQLNRWF
jgi:GR25 family glycosyltransferase involved in LPS biosynthesis